MTAPLAGYRVLELAHLVVGPVCGLYWPFARLVRGADVVIEAYRGGVAERLGVDYARVAPLNPRLVHCSVSAFGPNGPWREKSGLDMLVQAMGGLMSVMGEADGPPVCAARRCSTPSARSWPARASSPRSLHRERTGEGQRVDVSLLNGALLAHAARLSIFLATGDEPGRWGSGHPYMVPFQAFTARDGSVFVAVWVERLWRPFCEAIGRPALADDPRFATRDHRLQRRAELTALLADVFAGASSAHRRRCSASIPRRCCGRRAWTSMTSPGGEDRGVTGVTPGVGQADTGHFLRP